MPRPETTTAILDLEGQAGMVEAGMRLLDRSLGYEAAVVRGVGTAALYNLVATRPNPTSEHAILLAELPALRRIEAAVAIWAARSLPEQYQLRGLLTYGLKSGAIGRHYDQFDGSGVPGDICDGPLTFSLRVDQEPVRRIFYVEPTFGLSLTQDGLDADNERYLFKTCREDNRLDMTTIQQNPGDLVLFYNYPSPTIHAVDDPTDDTVWNNRYGESGGTKALIGTWQIEQVMAPSAILPYD